jgi:vesicle coat complex subunit
MLNINAYSEESHGGMNRINRLTQPKKGENFELRADLNSQYKQTRKEAIKMTIASMTVGKVGSLILR